MVKVNLEEREFVIKKLNLPISTDNQTLIYWILYSLGVITERDKKGLKAKLFLKLLEVGEALNAETLAELCKINRTTAIFHLKELQKKGLVRYEKNKYFVPAKKLSKIVSNLKNEILETLETIESITKLFEQNSKNT